MDAVSTSGFPEPSIMELGLRVRFVFPLAKKIAVADRAQSSTQSRPESQTGSPTQSTDPLIRLLRALVDGLLSFGELRKRLNLKHRPTFRENYLALPLKSQAASFTSTG